MQRELGFLGCLPFVGLLLVFVLPILLMKLPALLCARWRAVRWLPLLGLSYYGVGIGLTIGIAVGLDVVWWPTVWGQLGLIGLAMLGGHWLLPDPKSFVFNPAKRRATFRAVEYVELELGHHAIYGMVWLLGVEQNRYVFSVGVSGECKPTRRYFLAVSEEGRVEELAFREVERFGVQPWR